MSRSSSVGFTAHAVGFGLQGAETAALECRATEAGGRHFDAGDARALDQTLAALAVQESEAALPPDPVATRRAPDTIGRASRFDVSWTGPARAGDYIDMAPFDGAGTHSLDSVAVEAGSDSLSLTMPAELGEYVVRCVQPLTAEEQARIADGTRERALLFQQALTVVADAPDWSADIRETDADTAPSAAETATTQADGQSSAPATAGAGSTGSEPEDAALAEDVAYLCEEQLGCQIDDPETGISFFLRQGWGTDFLYRDGPGAPVRSPIFDSARSARLVPNAPAEITDGMLCLPSTMGPVCNLTPDCPAARLGAALLLQTVQPLNCLFRTASCKRSVFIMFH
ncbi:hypothetical protein ACN2XU_06400 [Primorskyibacter sp. 2E107]|uniref:hypothetical protein n=1 Tax=Primorskyibacter sp. 2E107 TaxID=3403458 RepID=UPI003AF6E80C